jgi:hypothetical protein
MTKSKGDAIPDRANLPQREEGRGGLFPEPGQGFRVLRLDSYGGEAVLTTEALAGMAGVTLDAIEQAVVDGELPEPWPMLGRKCWTQGQLADFLESRGTEHGKRKV